MTPEEIADLCRDEIKREKILIREAIKENNDDHFWDATGATSAYEKVIEWIEGTDEVG